MILYSRLDNKKTYCEFWGASTKHPDCVECLQNDIENKKFKIAFESEGVTSADILQWLILLASRKQWIFHAMEIIEDVRDSYIDFQHSKNYRVYD